MLSPFSIVSNSLESTQHLALNLASKSWSSSYSPTLNLQLTFQHRTKQLNNLTIQTNFNSLNSPLRLSNLQMIYRTILPPKFPTHPLQNIFSLQSLPPFFYQCFETLSLLNSGILTLLYYYNIKLTIPILFHSLLLLLK